MKFLVLGCNGMAGHTIALYLKEQGHDVVGFALEPSPYVETIVGDVTDFDAVNNMVKTGNYDVIINCIGVLTRFAEENHPRALLLNGYLPHFLAHITKDMPTQIIHISTDSVFSGAAGQYTETSVPDGTLFYDRSKAVGELIDDKNVTLRTSIVGPDINDNGIGLLHWFMQQKDSVGGFVGAAWTGLTTLQLAKIMEATALAHTRGLYHAVPDTSISKYELLKLFNQYIRYKPIEVRPIDRVLPDKTLLRTRTDGLDFIIPDYKTMVIELGEWMRRHKDMYPDYDL